VVGGGGSVCCSEDWLVNGGDSVWELPFS